ncbi:MAG: outer membrane beta-barrel protein [Bacteroidales bacterium]
MQKDKFDELFRRKLTGYEWDGELPEWSEIEGKIPQSASSFSFWRVAAAAVVILGTCGWLGIHFMNSLQSEEKPVMANADIPDEVMNALIPTESTNYPVCIESATKPTKQIIRDNTAEPEMTDHPAVAVKESQSEKEPEKKMTEPDHASAYPLHRMKNKHESAYDSFHHRRQPAKRRVTMGLLASNFTQVSKNDPMNNLIAYNSYEAISLAMDAQGRLSRTFDKNEISGFKHRMPLRAGFSVGYELFPRIIAETGILYSYHYSEFRQVASAHVDGTQRLHFLGVPVNLNYQLFERKYFRLYAGISGEVNINLHADQRFSLAGKNNSSKFRQKEPVWGAGINAGASYRLIRSLEIYLEPALMKYWSKGNLRSCWTDDKLAFNLNIGLRTLF